MLVSERKRRGNPALGAMAAQLPDMAEYLRTQGFGSREMATLEVADSAAIAGQLCFENIPRSEELAKVVEGLITAAKNEDSMLLRTGGVLASDLAWTQLASSSSSPARPWLDTKVAVIQLEDRPPPGERIKKLLESGEERAARELRLQVLWTRQLGEELAAIGAPVVKTIDDCLDPKRAYELLPMYRRWRLWLQEAKRPGRPADLVDYLLVLRDEPCARSVPEFKAELRATSGRLAWAAKDKIVEILHQGAPLIRRGVATVVRPPSYPTRRAEASGGPIGHHATSN